jgi:thiamine kinase-like enzyme/sulfur relay (sulfurtransferase) DsrC/TusE family protein
MTKKPLPQIIDAALNKTYMHGALTAVVQERFGKNTRILDLNIEHLHLRLIRYIIRIVDTVNEQPVEWKIIGKVYHAPDQMEYNFGVMQQLYKNGFSPEAGDGICIPQPLDCVPEVCLLLMAEATGSVLRSLIKKMAAAENHIGNLARAMVKLHQSSMRTGRLDTVEARLSACKPPLQTLALSYPSLADAVHLIVETAKGMQQRLGNGNLVLIHGDLHPGQVNVDHGNLWILDLDNLHDGDAAFDLAKVFAFFKRTARKKKMFHYIESLRDIFIAEYFSTMDWEIARRIPLYEALISLKRACKCLRFQDESDWENKLKQLVNQGASCIKLMEESPQKLDRSGVVELYHRSPGSI